ncbi:SCO6745 family protein [Aeromicrobium sp. 9AM]|uniref:SCO6745 family protein n=1 Tax=Aeromicrobium sp. 9AM TaxID=2653126 RepID=UPI0012F0E7BC|nr:MarR family transcriptional regulator [Aeromicrobium sp. 9AM]VXB63860.1 conserved hypothetical protein [Aeromicrobium sp. 9AM]
MESTGRRMFGLIEPIAAVSFGNQALSDVETSLGLRNIWDAYFAGRAAALGRVPAEVVHAAFYNFADGEVARHIPHVWDIATPEAALSARQQSSVAALQRRVAGNLLGATRIARAADLATRAATSAPTAGRVMYAALRTLPIPEEPVARLWHAATLLREHRGDGHIAALVTAGIGGSECHVLHALSTGTPAEKFGRVHHLPAAQLAAVIADMRARGLVDDTGWLTDAGRQAKERIEALTDELAAPAYDTLTPNELAELVAILEPVSAVLEAAGSE